MSEAVFSNIITVMDTTLIEEVVKLMVEKKISSVLVQDKNQMIVGIITERDIVRKFTLLDVSDKLVHTAATIMSRGVKFIRLDHIEADVIDLHMKERFRHFPILSGTEPLVSNVLGMISITDFVRRYILDSHSTLAAEERERDSKAEVEKKLISLGVLSNFAIFESYRKIFSQLGFKVFHIEDFNEFYKKDPQSQSKLIFDLDGMDVKILKTVIPSVRKYRNRVIFTTSQPQLVGPFRQGLDKHKHTISLKPIDISYFSWFLSQKIEDIV